LPEICDINCLHDQHWAKGIGIFGPILGLIFLSFAGALPKPYNLFTGTLLKELLTKVSEIPATVDFDVCGRVYEYFVGEFARTEGQKGGEFYTPRRRQKPRKQPRSEAYCAAKRAAHDSVKIPAQSSAENQQARLYRREMRE